MQKSEKAKYLEIKNKELIELLKKTEQIKTLDECKINMVKITRLKDALYYDKKDREELSKCWDLIESVENTVNNRLLSVVKSYIY